MQTVIPARKTPITKLDVIKSFKRVLTNF
ncbi:MAG: hypothetical protein RLY43_1867, partial [Bacteroidota bacterium]